MGSRRIFLSLLVIFVSSCFWKPTSAAEKAYVVYLGSHDHGHPEPNDEHFAKAIEYHYELLASVLGSKEKAQESLIYSYTKYINGFAAKLEKEEAEKLANHPDVVSIFLSKQKTLQTTHSWKFLGLHTIEAEPKWKMSEGSNLIIAALDTGVWPESVSFRDDGMGPIPSKWKGSCDKGIPCNRKLIGAKHFNHGNLAVGLKV